MGDPEAVARFAQRIVAAHGGIDIVVNNAVHVDPADGKVGDIEAQLWSSQMSTNVIGPWLVMDGGFTAANPVVPAFRRLGL